MIFAIIFYVQIFAMCCLYIDKISVWLSTYIFNLVKLVHVCMYILLNRFAIILVVIIIFFSPHYWWRNHYRQHICKMIRSNFMKCIHLSGITIIYFIISGFYFFLSSSCAYIECYRMFDCSKYDWIMTFSSLIQCELTKPIPLVFNVMLLSSFEMIIYSLA